MNKPTIIFLLILMIVSCGKRTELPINESQFQNKTFSLFFESEKDTLIVEFQDSTYQIFGNLWQGKIPWRISHYENANFLVLDNRVIGIKKTDKGKFECKYIGLTDNPFEMIERKPKWNKEQIYGTWIEEKYLNTDPINIPPPPPPPDTEENDFEVPPYYVITKDTIYSNFYYQKSKSKIDISNLGEFISLSLNSKFDEEDTFWKIKSLNDSVMILNRRFKYPHDNSYHIETEWDLKLIKKR